MAKKSRIDENNPALAFITTGKKIEEKPGKEEEKEIRSKRIQLVVTPNLYRNLKEAAWINRQSVNEYINQLIIKDVGNK